MTVTSTENLMTSGSPTSLVDALLAEQQNLTVVERFSRHHDSSASSQDVPTQEKYYQDLIPLAAPMADEQYAFEVDLDACSGCKACVAACHNLNGLEDDELWRSVGFLHGGTSDIPVLQHVTSACHHCLEPACLHGCPVAAYEKDPLTGIVRHLDDQCIGCQYCMLKCPYDVPKYSKSKGIVRKCDMCHDRLAVGEAPACVQACPTKAIRIRTVNKQSVVEESEGQVFLPGAPEPSYTLPTTVYKTERALPRNLLPADYYSVQSSHTHLPLVMMLVLTQMSVGAFVVDQALYSYFANLQSSVANFIRPMHLVSALMLGLLGLAASVFHLGRPFYAYRALLGLRTSWLSREILAFGAFAGIAAAYVGSELLGESLGLVTEAVPSALGMLACVVGIAGIFCSVMIYVDTRRPFWGIGTTTLKFFLTAIILGIPTALLVSLVAAAFSENLATREVMQLYGWQLCRVLIGAVAVKLTLEASVFTHLRKTQHTPLKRTALLMTGELGMTTIRRFFFGVLGGLVLPSVLLSESIVAESKGFDPIFLGILTMLILGLLITGELLERAQFFSASVAPKMPGTQPT